MSDLIWLSEAQMRRGDRHVPSRMTSNEKVEQ